MLSFTRTFFFQLCFSVVSDEPHLFLTPKVTQLKLHSFSLVFFCLSNLMSKSFCKSFDWFSSFIWISYNQKSCVLFEWVPFISASLRTVSLLSLAWLSRATQKLCYAVFKQHATTVSLLIWLTSRLLIVTFMRVAQRHFYFFHVITWSQFMLSVAWMLFHCFHIFDSRTLFMLKL